jgi:hypothetical protein
MKDAIIAVVLGAIVAVMVFGFDTLGERRPRVRQVAVLGPSPAGSAARSSSARSRTSHSSRSWGSPWWCLRGDQ